MKYAVIRRNIIHKIVISAAQAALRADVIEVPDTALNGQHYNDGDISDPPPFIWPTITKDEFLDRLSENEMIALHRLSATDDKIAIWKDRILNHTVIKRALIVAGLDYLISLGKINEARKAKLME